MGYKLEPLIWSRDTGQRIPFFDICQLTEDGSPISNMYAVN